jgi:hypothetical protein
MKTSATSWNPPARRFWKKRKRWEENPELKCVTIASEVSTLSLQEANYGRNIANSFDYFGRYTSLLIIFVPHRTVSHFLDRSIEAIQERELIRRQSELDSLSRLRQMDLENGRELP